MVRFYCPLCDKRLKVKSSAMEGRVITCPNCSRQIQVPVVTPPREGLPPGWQGMLPAVRSAPTSDSDPWEDGLDLDVDTDGLAPPLPAPGPQWPSPAPYSPPAAGGWDAPVPTSTGGNWQTSVPSVPPAMGWNAPAPAPPPPPMPIPVPVSSPWNQPTVQPVPAPAAAQPKPPVSPVMPPTRPEEWVGRAEVIPLEGILTPQLELLPGEAQLFRLNVGWRDHMTGGGAFGTLKYLSFGGPIGFLITALILGYKNRILLTTHRVVIFVKQFVENDLRQMWLEEVASIGLNRTFDVVRLLVGIAMIGYGVSAILDGDLMVPVPASERTNVPPANAGIQKAGKKEDSESSKVEKRLDVNRAIQFASLILVGVFLVLTCSRMRINVVLTSGETYSFTCHNFSPKSGQQFSSLLFRQRQWWAIQGHSNSTT